MKDNLNHRIAKDATVEYRRKPDSHPVQGTVITVNPSGSYGIRFGSGRASHITEAQPIQLTEVKS